VRRQKRNQRYNWHPALLSSWWRQQLEILGTLLHVTDVIVLRYKMRCMHLMHAHALLTCRDVGLCALRRKYAHLCLPLHA